MRWQRGEVRAVDSDTDLIGVSLHRGNPPLRQEPEGVGERELSGRRGYAIAVHSALLVLWLVTKHLSTCAPQTEGAACGDRGAWPTSGRDATARPRHELPGGCLWLGCWASLAGSKRAVFGAAGADGRGQTVECTLKTTIGRHYRGVTSSPAVAPRRRPFGRFCAKRWELVWRDLLSSWLILIARSHIVVGELESPASSAGRDVSGALPYVSLRHVAGWPAGRHCVRRRAHGDMHRAGARAGSGGTSAPDHACTGDRPPPGATLHSLLNRR